MPRNNSAARRAERRLAAEARKRARNLQQSSHANLRVIGMMSLKLQQIRQDEENRLCDTCTQPKRVCVPLNTDIPDPHIFSPMTPEQQLRLEEERETARLVEQDIRNQHFAGHKPDCTMPPRVCYAVAGISAAS